jgi:hypothetical protein
MIHWRREQFYVQLLLLLEVHLWSHLSMNTFIFSFKRSLFLFFRRERAGENFRGHFFNCVEVAATDIQYPKAERKSNGGKIDRREIFPGETFFLYSQDQKK